jgi:hypothetical protein
MEFSFDNLPMKISGVTESMMYAGCSFSCFGGHIEGMDVCVSVVNTFDNIVADAGAASASYLHSGIKIWYVVPAQQRYLLEEVQPPR